MTRLVLSTPTLEVIESELFFPEACKFCPEENCIGCPFREERIELEADLLLAKEPTIEKYELQELAYKNRRKK